VEALKNSAQKKSPNLPQTGIPGKEAMWPSIFLPVWLKNNSLALRQWSMIDFFGRGAK
jgi:hypothetical protein